MPPHSFDQVWRRDPLGPLGSGMREGTDGRMNEGADPKDALRGGRPRGEPQRLLPAGRLRHPGGDVRQLRALLPADAAGAVQERRGRRLPAQVLPPRQQVTAGGTPPPPQALQPAGECGTGPGPQSRGGVAGITNGTPPLPAEPRRGLRSTPAQPSKVAGEEAVSHPGVEAGPPQPVRHPKGALLGRRRPEGHSGDPTPSAGGVSLPHLHLTAAPSRRQFQQRGGVHLPPGLGAPAVRLGALELLQPQRAAGPVWLRAPRHALQQVLGCALPGAPHCACPVCWPPGPRSPGASRSRSCSCLPLCARISPGPRGPPCGVTGAPPSSWQGALTQNR